MLLIKKYNISFFYLSASFNFFNFPLLCPFVLDYVLDLPPFKDRGALASLPPPRAINNTFPW